VHFKADDIGPPITPTHERPCKHSMAEPHKRYEPRVFQGLKPVNIDRCSSSY